jgi:flagellar hook assembly protein FlgD
MFDILVVNRNGKEVYRWSHNKCFTTAIVDVELKESEKLAFSELWDCKNNQGIPVPPDKYTISVIFLAKFKEGKVIDIGSLTAAKDIEIVY